jgi:sugar lactone lactonase YvrE
MRAGVPAALVAILALGVSAARALPGPGGRITRFAGDGSSCLSARCGDGGRAVGARLNDPSGVAVDARGDAYVADGLEGVVWRVSPRGTIARFAGDGKPCPAESRCGDGGQARRAQLDNPVAVAVGGDGAVYVVDQGAQEVRKVSTAGVITRVAGDGRPCSTAPRCGDGGPAIRARLAEPWGVAVDRSGNVYIADYLDDEVRKVSPDGRITRLAGTGRQCARPRDCGDGGPATRARLFLPAGVAVDESGNVYIADSDDHEVRLVTPSGRITTFARDGRNARLSIPFGVAVDVSGAVYVTDIDRNDVVTVAQSGVVTRVAGDGRRCSTPRRCGDGGPALRAELTDPTGVAVDAHHNLLIADSGDQEVRKVADG